MLAYLADPYDKSGTPVRLSGELKYSDEGYCHEDNEKIGEIKLLWAVLKQAAIDLTAPVVIDYRPWDKKLSKSHQQRLQDRKVETEISRREVRAWLTSRAKRSWSFLWICDHLKIDSNRTRRDILALPIEQSDTVIPDGFKEAA